MRIAILVPELTSLNREIIRGIRAFAKGRPTWRLRAETVARYESIPESQAMETDGFIIHHGAPWGILNTSQPIVNLIQIDEAVPWSVVTTDNQAVGRIAAEYFLKRGFKSFAVVGRVRKGITQVNRLGAFASVIQSHGYQVPSYDLPQRRGESLHVADRRAVHEWMNTLPTPTAILTFNDRVALVLLEICKEFQIPVPDKIAIMGVQNDDLWCEMAHVTLTSVALNGRKIGYEAAATLDRLFRGESSPDRLRLIPPIGVVSRGSTDIWAVDDPDVANALKYIAHHASDLISVEDVQQGMGVSRRSLERRFKAVLGRTVLEEIRRCRLQRAQDMLVETSEDMTAIARLCGFSSREYFTQVFKEHVGHSPGAYRDLHRI